MAQQRPPSFIPESFVPDKPKSFIPESFVPDEPKKEETKEEPSWYNWLTESFLPDLPEPTTGHPMARFGKSVYDKFIQPATSPAGIGLAATGGGLAMFAPRVLGAGLTGLGAYEATRVPGTISDIATEGFNPENVTDLIGEGLGLAGISPGLRLMRPSKASALISEVLPAEINQGQRLLTGGFEPHVINAPKQLTGKVDLPEIIDGEIVLPRQLGPAPERLALPAVGETSITGTPRFYQGNLGIADDLMDYPIDLVDWAKLRGEGTLLPNELGELGFLPPEIAATRGLGSSQLQMPIAGRFRDYGKIPNQFDSGNIYAPVGEPRAFIPDAIRSQRFRPDTTLEQPLGGRVINAPERPSTNAPFRSTTLTPEESSILRGPLTGEIVGENLNIPLHRSTTVPGARESTLIREGAVPTIDKVGKQIRKPGQHRKSLLELLQRTKQNPASTSANDLKTIARAVKEEPEKSSLFNELWNFNRSLMASVDFSAPFRQAFPSFARFDKEWWTSLDDMFKAFGSRKSFNAIQEGIESSPTYNTSISSGVKYTGLGKLSQREEAFFSKWAEKIPMIGRGVAASNRAHVAFLNKLRSDLFATMYKNAKLVDPNIDTNQLKLDQIGSLINNITGRGNLPKFNLPTLGGRFAEKQVNLERYATLLNQGLFSPRLIASRVQFFNPNNYIRTDPFVRKEYLKSLIGMAGLSSSVIALAKVSGADVGLNPTSADFGKIKFGNVRVDPYGGFQQYIVPFTKFVTGQDTSTMTNETRDLNNPRFGGPTRSKVVGKFARSKAHPMIGLALDIMDAKDFSGKPINIPEHIAKQFIPMFMKDMYELTNENPELLPFLGPIGALGVGVQVYDR